MAPPLQLPILVTFPSAPLWLVSNYVVSAGFISGGQKHSGGSQTFDHQGGTFTGTVTSNDQGVFPTEVTVEYSVEYTPESGLDTLTDTKTLPVTPAGARFTLHLPHRRLAETSIVFDFAHGVLDGDFLTVGWKYILGGAAITVGSKFVDYPNLLPGNPRPAKSVDFGFILDPAPTVSEKLHLEIGGRIFGKDLPLFKDDRDLPAPLLIAMVKDDPAGDGMHVEIR